MQPMQPVTIRARGLAELAEPYAGKWKSEGSGSLA